jgi:hypothetical protein
MSYIYKTKGTCSTQIELELEGDVVHNVKKYRKDVKIYVIIMYTQKNENTGG